MYSDRVDSVTRATNPSLLPSLPSTLGALLVRRPPPPPPPPPPTRHLPMHRRIKHSPSISPEFFPRCFSLFLSLIFSRLVFRCPSRPLASLTRSPRLARLFCSLSPSAVFRSRCFFHYFIISLSLRVSNLFFLSSFILLLNISSTTRHLSLRE